MIEEGIDYKEIGDNYETLQEITIHTGQAVPPQMPRSAKWAKGKCHLRLPTAGGSVLTIQKGYVWDGASTKLRDLNKPETMEATLHHDALYEALRGCFLPSYGKRHPVSDPKRQDWVRWKKARRWADKCFREILERDGGWHPDVMEFAVQYLNGATAAWPEKWLPLMRFLIELGQNKRN